MSDVKQAQNEPEMDDDENFQKAWKQKKTGLTVVEGALAVISTSLGSGIISVPYAMTVAGVKFAMVINLVCIGFVLYGTYLCMKAREAYQINSHSDLCFLCFGKKSVYIANFLVSFCLAIVMILFIVLFAQVSQSIFATRVITENTSIWAWVLSQRWFYIVFILFT